jgi:hypothetical protein
MRPRAIRAALLAGCISAALAHAEDGAMPAPGNVLNPAPVNPSTAGRWMDEEGMGTRIPAARSPIGRLYNMPLDAGGEAPARDVPGWINSAYIEFGLVRSSGTGTRGIPGYLDFDSGIYLNTYALTAEKPSEARFFEATGGAVGRDDQFHHVQFGRYNDWKVTAWFDGSPMALTSNYRSLWGGTGTSSLNLSTLTPGGGANAAATQTAIQNALAATPPGELDIVRRRAGVRLDSHLSTSWRMFASFVDDKRDGARPFGMVFGGGGGGGNFEAPQSIDYETQDFVAGVQFVGERNSFNLRASASFFRNGIDTMTVQNPLFVTLNGTNGLSPNLFTQGRIRPSAGQRGLQREGRVRARLSGVLPLEPHRHGSAGIDAPGRQVHRAHAAGTDRRHRHRGRRIARECLEHPGRALPPVGRCAHRYAPRGRGPRDEAGQRARRARQAALLRDAQPHRILRVQSAHGPVGAPAQRRQRPVDRDREHHAGRECRGHVRQCVQHRELQPGRRDGDEPGARRRATSPSPRSRSTTGRRWAASRPITAWAAPRA